MNRHPHAPHAHHDDSGRKPEQKTPESVFGELIPEIQKAVEKEGYTTPTPIQEQCIPHLLKGKDLMGTAQTGTGKTAAFTLPLLQRLNEHSRRPRPCRPRALILAPTRELAAQIGESIETYGRFLRMSHTVVFGGVSQSKQVKAMKRGVDILVATPGRLLDLMQQGFISLGDIEVFILDEVDRMLDMGFIPDVKRILSKIPKTRQTSFFSATMPPRIVSLAKSMVHDPVHVTIAPEAPTVEKIAQKVFFVPKGDKDKLLVSLLSDPGVDKVLVFTQMKHSANRVMKRLVKAGISVDAIHGNKTQKIRTRTLSDFKKGSLKVLVATDVAARGLDVDDITHVINYDLPVEAETYVHRIGRTARAGADGDAISFCCFEDRTQLQEIEKLLGKPVPVETDHPYHCDEAARYCELARKHAAVTTSKGASGRRRRSNPFSSRGRRGLRAPRMRT